jgi:glycosyltransferase involved in cell wall biosynthesis
MMPSLTIDFRMHNASGIGTHIRNIVPYLVDKFNITLLGNTKEIEKYDWSDRVNIIDIKSKIYSIKEQLELPLKIPKCDVFWSPHYNIPILPIKAKKRAVTIHDVFHLAFYNQLNFRQKIYAKFVINQAVNRSDLVITGSNFSANEIRKYTNTSKNIEIIYNAVDLNKFKIIKDKETLNKIKVKYNLPNEFILFVGNVKPHKNLRSLLLALKELDINLVIVGKKEGFITRDENILNLIKENNLENRIFFTGYVPDEDLSAIYNLAKIFAFPSLYEGFGIPPLEAQACGCPVICSNVASLPEVYGDSVLYCDPYNVDDIKEKIEYLINNETLREQLKLKGLKNAKRFSWGKSARKIIKIFKRLSEK